VSFTFLVGHSQNVSYHRTTLRSLQEYRRKSGITRVVIIHFHLGYVFNCDSNINGFPFCNEVTTTLKYSKNKNHQVLEFIDYRFIRFVFKKSLIELTVIVEMRKLKVNPTVGEYQPGRRRRTSNRIATSQFVVPNSY